MTTVIRFVRQARLIRQLLAALRVLLVLTVILGIAYPLLITGIVQIPGLASRANGSTIRIDGREAGSTLIGQSFHDANGDPLPQYFQPRPSAAGDGYDPTATSASNLGPESVVDVLPDPTAPADTDAAAGTPSLLTQVCTRSLEIGRANGVSGARPFCTPDGVGAVLGVFWSGPGYAGQVTRVVSLDQACPHRPFLATYHGHTVRCATFGEDYAAAQIVPVRGDAPETPAVPADAVTASGSGLDPDISPAYAALQTARVAKARQLPFDAVAAVVARATNGRDLGFLGEPTVNVVQLNRALDDLARG